MSRGPSRFEMKSSAPSGSHTGLTFSEVLSVTRTAVPPTGVTQTALGLTLPSAAR
jgi:hypothetical protein